MSRGSTQKWANGLIELSPQGLFCRPGGFHVDPWKGADRALITHGHADHARSGSQHYTCSQSSEQVLALRLGKRAPIGGWPYGEKRKQGSVWVSFHPAGHVLGSAQIRIEGSGHVAVITGDYKRAADPSCQAFEPVGCDTLITESTFGLPIYRWPDPEAEFAKINSWWRSNQASGKTSVLYAYSLGKAQRILTAVDPTIGPIAVHRTVAAFLPAYRDAGFKMPSVETIHPDCYPEVKHQGLVVVPPSADGKWLSALNPISEAGASGWMRVRGMRRWRSLDQGFVISDHADWPGLMQTIRDSGANSIGVTHGYTAEMVKYLQGQGLHAYEVPTRFNGDREDATTPEMVD